MAFKGLRRFRYRCADDTQTFQYENARRKRIGHVTYPRIFVPEPSDFLIGLCVAFAFYPRFDDSVWSDNRFLGYTTCSPSAGYLLEYPVVISPPSTRPNRTDPFSPVLCLRLAPKLLFVRSFLILSNHVVSASKFSYPPRLYFLYPLYRLTLRIRR